MLEEYYDVIEGEVDEFPVDMSPDPTDDPTYFDLVLSENYTLENPNQFIEDIPF